MNQIPGEKMVQLKFTFFMLVLISSTLIGAPTLVMAQNSVEGKLTVDGQTAAIKHVYFDQYREEFTIILTDNPVAAEMIPDGIHSLSEQGKLRALEFTVSRETQNLLSRMRKAIYFHPVWARNIDIGEAVLTISKFDKKMLAGTIKTTSENENYGHNFSYDISFSVSLEKEPLKLTVTGKTDAPSKAYAAYCKALLAGDVDELKKHVPGEKLEMMPKDPKELVLDLKFVQETMMTDMEILTSTITGKKAVLTLKGSRGIATADGTVTMLQENGAWKVSEESWELGTAEKD